MMCKLSFSHLEDARYLQEPEIVTKLPKMKQLLEETQLCNLDTNSSVLSQNCFQKSLRQNQVLKVTVNIEN